MNKHRKGLYIIAGLFYLFFSGALALYPTKMTVGATVSMIAGAVLTLIAAIASFVLAAQCKTTQNLRLSETGSCRYALSALRRYSRRI